MIKVENVSKVYKINNIDKEILSNVNIRINPGDIFGIVGSTGGGKTTLLKLLNGFIEPDSGVITFEDGILNHTSKKEIVKQTSTIFQEYNLLNNLTVTENVLLPTKFREKEKYNSKEKAFELLDFVKLNDFKTSYIKTLSGGQKQRVAIARSLITNPKVIFCDEPTSALDESMSYEILKLLKDVNEKYNTTIVIVSHNINVIKSLCNKVAILNNGTVEDVLELKETSLSLLNYKEALLND